MIAYFGILKAGGVVVNFNPLYADREIEHQILDSGVAIMVTMGLEGLVAKLRPQFERTPLRPHHRLLAAQGAALGQAAVRALRLGQAIGQDRPATSISSRSRI